MSEQLDLLEWSESICRKSDPVTSFVAASNTAPKLVGLRLQLVEGVTKLGGAATANEAAAAMTDNHSLRESIRKRANECVTNGILKIVGKRVCKITGNQSQLYGLISETTDAQSVTLDCTSGSEKSYGL